MAFGKQHSVARHPRPTPPPQMAPGNKAATVPGGGPDPDDNMPASNAKRAKGKPVIANPQVASFPGGRTSASKKSY